MPCRILQGFNLSPHPRQWKHGVLTAGLPRNSIKLLSMPCLEIGRTGRETKVGYHKEFSHLVIEFLLTGICSRLLWLPQNVHVLIPGLCGYYFVWQKGKKDFADMSQNCKMGRWFWIISSVQSLSPVQLFVTPWTAGRQASLSITNSQNLFNLTSIESVMPSNHLIFCRPLLFPPSICPSIKVFSNESVLCIRWPKYWSFSFSISPFNEYSELTSFRMD